MGNPVMIKEYDQSQRYAICQRQWSDHKAKAAYVVTVGDDEYAEAKEPIDTDIKEREKRAGNPPKGAPVIPDGGACPNPDGNVKKKMSEMPVFMGGLELAVDEQGIAKWPLSFKRIEKDTKRPNKTGDGPVKNSDKATEQPPTAS